MRYQKILLVDDDEDDQEIFLLAVNQLPGLISCTTLQNATEALKKLTAKEVEPDVIFLDLNMPGMNGEQFLTEIKKNEELVNIPVIIFSTSSHLATIALMKGLGACDFITKPASFDELVGLLKPLLS